MGKSKTSFNATIGWALVACFFCYQYLLRVTPGVISGELRHAFMMTAEEFSTLGAYYLYAYSLLQIPLGFIVDRLGVKRTVLISLLLCISGTFLITTTEELWLAQFSRVLIGAGSASAFMSALKWVADHFPAGKRGFLMGATLTLGTAGALSAGVPLVYLVEHFSWQHAVEITGFIGIGLFVFILIALKDNERPVFPPLDRGKMLADLKSISTNKMILIYALLAVGLYTPLSVLADLWGVSFIMEKYNLTRSDAASTTMMMYLGLAIGSLTLPMISERFQSFTQSIRLCSFALLGLFSFVLFSSIPNPIILKSIFFLIGVFCGAEMICFTGALLNTTADKSGLTIGFVNTLNMMGGAILQQIIGKALDVQWQGAVDDAGVRTYSTDQYIFALSVLVIVLVGCAVLSLGLRDDKNEAQQPM